nr:hypothetical protein [Rhodoferax sp.]
MLQRTECVEFAQVDAYALPESLGLFFNGAFASLWLSHVPIHVQLEDFPIVETDADGNTYQRRTLRDGTVHRVLKNLPSENEIRALFAPFVSAIEFRQLQNFCLLEYKLTGGTNLGASGIAPCHPWAVPSSAVAGGSGLALFEA